MTALSPTRLAFTDSTLEQSALRAMAGNLLLIALAALVVLLGCSYLLSGVAARPVERAWQEQQRFLSDASHELKTPLTVILSSADLLAESAPAEEQTYVENIRAESRRMKKLVEEMLTLFRAESVRRETAFSEVDLSDVVTDALPCGSNRWCLNPDGGCCTPSTRGCRSPATGTLWSV